MIYPEVRLLGEVEEERDSKQGQVNKGSGENLVVMAANWLAGRTWLRKRLKQTLCACYANSKTQLTTYNLLILLQMSVRLPWGHLQ